MKIGNGAFHGSWRDCRSFRASSGSSPAHAPSGCGRATARACAALGSRAATWPSHEFAFSPLQALASARPTAGAHFYRPRALQDADGRSGSRSSLGHERWVERDGAAMGVRRSQEHECLSRSLPACERSPMAARSTKSSPPEADRAPATTIVAAPASAPGRLSATSSKWIHACERVLSDGAGPKLHSLDGPVEASPALRRKLGRDGRHRLLHVFRQAADMDMQLILRTCELRVHRERNVLARDRRPPVASQDRARAPRHVEIVRRVVGSEFEFLDARDFPRRAQNDVGVAHWRPEDHITALHSISYVRFETGKRGAGDLVVDPTHLNDAPQRLTILRSRGGRKGSQRRGGEQRGSQSGNCLSRSPPRVVIGLDAGRHCLRCFRSSTPLPAPPPFPIIWLPCDCMNSYSRE